ncbi:MAG: pyridoxal phosphate-dependent aminotransferase [candidate division KSB1 bacterium]|nr:pyridoxal phosphate-dependent aminotransferase [candidate division KSB1 bacterium]MDZ7304606.1 pyridoxal phosphate-dependent aminotransferase [candidate division KSB1 bacterium]MDZ7313739.1 pyridoxal phosphate-dependent aminotransferase [candidate division KSB1 bacterium]
MQFAKRMERLGTETAFEVLARAKALEAQGRKIIHLEIGEPDFDTPLFIREAAMESLRKGRTHYTPAAGIPELRQAICEDVARRRGITVRPENVAVTPGAKPIMYFTITALIEEGDEVIYPNPGFPIYESVIEFVGGKAVPLPLREEKEFRFDLKELQALITDRTRMIIINSPQNPTGGILTREDIRAIAEIARSRNIMVLSDEVYKNIIYEDEHYSILCEPGMLDHTILLDGFSKTYAMTGWRLGFGVMPVALAQKVEKLMINSNSCTATFTQDAGVAALRGPQEETFAFVREFKRRRDIMVQGLNQIKGVHCLTPRGAFYCFPNVSRVPMATKPLADLLLNEAGVAVLSGTAFGKFGEGYLRFSYANSVENIQEGLRKVKQVIEAL